MHILQRMPPNLSVVRKQMSRAKNGRPPLLPVVRPADILLPEDKRLSDQDIYPETEQWHLNFMDELQADNKRYKSLIGRGWYGTNTPAK